MGSESVISANWAFTAFSVAESSPMARAKQTMTSSSLTSVMEPLSATDMARSESGSRTVSRSKAPDCRKSAINSDHPPLLKAASILARLYLNKSCSE